MTMKYFLILPALFLMACSGMTAKEFKDIDDYTAEEILANKKPIGSKSKEKAKAAELQLMNPNAAAALYTTIPLVRKEGVMSFEQWKKAKEENSQEYQEYLEYREYLQTLQSQ